MKRFIYLLGLLASLLSLGSCTKYSFRTIEEKVVGTWTFEKVKNKPGVLKASIDITKNYKNWEYTFDAGGSVTAVNTITKETELGRWHLEEYVDVYYDEDGNSTTTSEYVLRFFLRAGRGAEHSYNWNVGSVTAKRLRASEYYGKETFTYVLARKN